MSTPNPLTIEQRLAALEAKAKSWLSGTWQHIVTWVGIAYAIYKHL